MRQFTLTAVSLPIDPPPPAGAPPGTPPGVPPEIAPPGWVPDFSPDPDEPPPLELWSAVGDVPPWGTVLLLLACALPFAAQAARGELGEAAALIAWGANLRGAEGLDRAWRLLASTFLHSGALHLVLNSISLLIFGVAVEAIYARRSFWIVYAMGGAAASAASLAVRESRATGAILGVGASGAIFALAGALLVAAVRLRRRLAPGRSRALAGAMLFLVAQSLAGGVEKPNTDHVAHLAGLAAGALLGLVAPLNRGLEPQASPRAFGADGTYGGPRPWRRAVAGLALAAGVLSGLALALALGLALARGLGLAAF